MAAVLIPRNLQRLAQFWSLLHCCRVTATTREYCYEGASCYNYAMADIGVVSSIMQEFATNTGLEPASKSPRRYLWTDAFAVCNFLELHKRTGDVKFKELALCLVDQVHNTLGSHRGDDPQGRRGWISGLQEEEGVKHPTKGGLRIGKKFPERQPREPFDDDAEWDKDGQYYHYLTKWMQAMANLFAATGENRFVLWGAELAAGVHDKFTYSTGSHKRMFWKMSIDLSRPQVRSMGHHDPLDGFVIYYQLQASLPADSGGISLEGSMDDLRSIMQGQDFSTTDPLGLGGILADAYRVLQLYVKKEDEYFLTLFGDLLKASLAGLKGYNKRRLDLPAEYRLAFREFGLSIGLQAATRVKDLLVKHREVTEKAPKLSGLVDKILEYLPLKEVIHGFWSEESHRKSSTWTGHLDINMVMWATSLMPDGFLKITS